MEVAAITSVGTGETDTLTPEEMGLTSDASNSGALGKSEFLRLLTMQLQYQDPLDPMDNTEMIAQLAQFSALEQMQNVSAELKAARQESGLVLAGVLSGESVTLEMSDGSSVSGVVEACRWTEDGVSLDIGGSSYALGDVTRLTRGSAASWTAGG
jgi:flagellar basal-body rod modification protein FlgD